MEISGDLIKRFFEKRCTPAEAELVMRYLKDNLYVQDQYLRDAEWNEAPEEYQVEEEFLQDAWLEIQKKKNRKRNTFLMIRRISVAACVAGLCLLGYLYLNSSADKLPASSNTQLASTETVIRNTSDSVMHVLLPDSSIAGLLPGSTISYEPAFQNNSRNLHLKGEATFKVTKDALRPFTVYSDALSVTALGTFFSVTSNPTSRHINVKLYEGKVLVQKIRKDSSLSTAYLDPGMELTYNDRTLQMYIKTFGKNINQLVKTNKSINRLHSIPLVQGSFTFNNQSMNDVFRTLEVLYDIEIRYRPKDMEGLYFIGKFDHTDSLKEILKTICLLNNLQITENEPGKYSLNRKK